LHCGNKEIQAQDLEREMARLSEIDQDKHMSGFEIEFEVGNHTRERSCIEDRKPERSLIKKYKKVCVATTFQMKV
jgi:hypothetical protein